MVKADPGSAVRITVGRAAINDADGIAFRTAPQDTADFNLATRKGRVSLPEVCLVGAVHVDPAMTSRQPQDQGALALELFLKLQ